MTKPAIALVQSGEIKIDKGVSIAPHGNTGKARPSASKYPFAKLEVGDSFFSAARVKSVASSAKTFKAKHPGWQYTCRTVTENGVKGVRVWRVE